MSPEPNFDELRRLLALKRHEQPPPGYFSRFSSQVVTRIQRGERGEPARLWDRWFREAAWWQRVTEMLEARPALTGASGAVACALLISGLVYSENGPMPIEAVGVAAPEIPTLATAPSTSPALAEVGSSDQPQQYTTSGTNSIWNFPSLKAETVSYQIPTN